MRINVVGGGIIGLACAWRLARDGHTVTVLDAAPEAREASWAAGGMLAPHNEAEPDSPLWRLGCTSLARWPGFLADLGVTDDAVDHRQRGGLVPVLDAVDVDEVAATRDRLQQAGVACEWWDAAHVAEQEPALAGADGALLLPAGQVDPRRILGVLTHACDRVGVRLRYACAVERLDGATAVATGGAVMEADLTVLASGAWTPALAGLAKLDLAGEPVKGQMICFATLTDLLSRFVHCRHAYCIPRQGVGLVVGATMVCAGFDRSEDAAGIAELAAGARRLLPGLAHVPVAETWTGLRPRLAGGLPLIDRINEHLVVATGHFRNGILLAPTTADLVADLVQGAAPEPACAWSAHRAGSPRQ